MVETYDLAIALFDYTPNILFMVGILFIYDFLKQQKIIHSENLFLLGGVITALGGFFKAIWKTLMVIEVDINILTDYLFVFQSIGFILMVTALLLFLQRGKKSNTLSATNAIAAWKIPFMITMVIAAVIGWLILAYISWKRNLRLSSVLYIISLVLFFGLAGICSGELTIQMQWVAEIINTTNQTCFAGASYLLWNSMRN